jgi:beta-xylosidase
MDAIGGKVTDHGVALDIKDVPWAGRQMWAPDAAEKDGKYFLYFPVKDKQDVFRIGAAVSDNPAGPFKADPQAIEGSYSMDPAVFKDRDGKYYMYFGGIWGGQLQHWASGSHDPSIGASDLKQDDKPALSAKVARMGADMKSYAEAPRDVQILDAEGKPILGGDHERRFFEGSWMYKRGDTYYFTYSTGDTHFLNYATGDNPYGPFTFRGHFLLPPQGWTSHHSIVDWNGKTWLFYHDTQLSGKNHLRNVKVTELKFNDDGTIQPVDAFLGD